MYVCRSQLVLKINAKKRAVKVSWDSACNSTATIIVAQVLVFSRQMNVERVLWDYVNTRDVKRGQMLEAEARKTRFLASPV